MPGGWLRRPEDDVRGGRDCKCEDVPEAQHHVPQEEVQVAGTPDSSWFLPLQPRRGAQGNTKFDFPVLTVLTE